MVLLLGEELNPNLLEAIDSCAPGRGLTGFLLVLFHGTHVLNLPKYSVNGQRNGVLKVLTTISVFKKTCCPPEMGTER